MAAIKLLHLLALSTLAILASSFGSTQVTALATDKHHVVRHNVARGHDAIAKRKRSNTKRCKKRPSSSSSQAAPTSSKTPVSTPPPTASTKDQPKPSSTPAKQSSSPAPAPSPVSQNVNGGGKICLAWPNGDDPSLANFKMSEGAVLYTWSPDLPNNAKSLGFNPVPMLWGEDQTTDFQKLVVKGYANTVLGFNEPNQSGQSNMSPQRGAQLWQQYIQPLKSQGYSLIAPAVSSAPSGKVWMQEFFAACQGCSFDGIGMHYYDVTAAGLIAYAQDFHDTFGLDLWITEYACQNFNGGAQCNGQQVTEFTNTVINFVESTPWVAHACPFGVMHDMQGVNTLNQLMASNGEPTALGQVYLSAA